MRPTCLFACISFALATGIAFAQTASPVPPLEDVRELAPQWWRWRVSLPALALPDKDVVGHFCDVGQSRTTWFLGSLLSAGGAIQPVRRSCAVPSGRSLFFPVVTLLRIVNGDVTCSSAQAQVSAGIDRADHVSVTLDGVEVSPARFSRWSSDGSCFRLGLLADGPSSNLTAAADGFWLLLKPLPPGHHTLVYGAMLASEQTNAGRLQSTTYDIDVD